MFKPSNQDDLAQSGKAGGEDRPELKSLLVIDSDAHYLYRLRNDSSFGAVQPVLASLAQAEVILADPSARFRAILLGTEIAATILIPLVKRIHAEHPATPIFLLYRDRLPFTYNEASR